MARVTYGDIITNLTGSIGGTTFQQTKAGNIARSRPSTHKVSTPIQTTRHREYASISRRWDSLTLVQQEVWNTFADANPKKNRYDQTKTLTGYQMYMSVNMNRFYVNFSRIDAPNTADMPDPYPLDEWSVTGSALTIKAAGTPTSSEDGLLIYCTPPLRSPSPNMRSEFRLIESFNSWDLDDIVVTADWEAYFNFDYPPSRTTGDLVIALQVVTVDNSSGFNSVRQIAISSV